MSYAQNREDVVLWRALGHLPHGRYVEVGANHPRTHSVSRAFYDHGWSGVTVEPVHEFAEMHRTERPRDVLVEAAVVAVADEDVTLYTIPGTGLSTVRGDISEEHRSHGWDPEAGAVPTTTLRAILEEHPEFATETHFLLVDTEGSERGVLESADLRAWRPWVVVVEATAPLTNRPTHGEWEDLLTGAGYEFTLFDGISRFYVAEEHAPTLRGALSYPACALDPFVDADQAELRAALDAGARSVEQLERSRAVLLNDLVRWRSQAVTAWAAMVTDEWKPEEVTHLRNEVRSLHRELAAMRETLSWRVTSPLRTVRRLGRTR